MGHDLAQNDSFDETKRGENEVKTVVAAALISLPMLVTAAARQCHAWPIVDDRMEKLEE